MSQVKKKTIFKLNDVIQGDVIEVLRDLRERERESKFDVIIADPPYNIGKDFGNDSDKQDLRKYLKWSKEWIDLCFDVLSDNGLIYIYGFAEILAHIAVLFPINKQRFLVWHYTNKTSPSSEFWQRSHESILCLWKKDRPTLEIDQIREPYTVNYLKLDGKTRNATPGRFGHNGRETKYKVNSLGALPRDVIKIPALAGGAGSVERHFMCKTCGNKLYKSNQKSKHKDHNLIIHPTQKPIKLTQKLIFSRINGNNGRTLVPFAGSGSECVAAIISDIEFLGIELNPEYVAYAKEWIKLAEKSTDKITYKSLSAPESGHV